MRREKKPSGKRYLQMLAAERNAKKKAKKAARLARNQEA